MAMTVAGLAIMFGSAAWAHRPIFTEGDPSSAESAIAIEDPDLSQVVYYEITQEAPRLWLTFKGQPDQEVYLQVGIPLIDRLEAFRPAMALVGPGLPEAEVPFDLPDGCGALVFPTDDVAEPRRFHEPFTGTRSWILREERVNLTEAGDYYAVAFVPSGDHGKMWLSIGTREDWGVGDVGKLPEWTKKVRAFHETGGGWPRLQKIAAGGLAAILAGTIWLIVRLFNQ